MNRPYVKTIGKDGIVLNPITKLEPFINYGENRRERRSNVRFDTFKGNKKGVSLTISNNIKYHRVTQVIKDSLTGTLKFINHYLLKQARTIKK